MKKIVLFFMMASASLMVCADNKNISKEESLARKNYFKAMDYFEAGDAKSALKYVDLAEKALNKTNARLSYVKAKALYQQGDLVETQKACSKYFSSNPMQDNGYFEMTKILDDVTTQLNAAAAQRREEAAAQREAQIEAAARAEAEAKERADVMASAAERRAKDAETQAAVEAKIVDEFKAVQAKNSKDAYQQFIYTYPSSKTAVVAKSEMLKKWPAPVRVMRKNKYGYQKGNELVIKAKYDNASEFSEGLARVGKANKYGFVTEDGKEIVPIQFSAASNFSYGFAAVKLDEGNCYFIDKTGKKLDDQVYSDARAFNEGLAPVQAKDSYLYGFIDTKGNTVIEPKFNNVSWFYEGLAAVCKNVGGAKRYAYINKDGKAITDFVFEEAKDFQNGVARVKSNGKFGLIDKFGAPITECVYDYISDFANDGYALAKKSNIKIYLDREGGSWAKVNGKYVEVKF